MRKQRGEPVQRLSLFALALTLLASGFVSAANMHEASLAPQGASSKAEPGVPGVQALFALMAIHVKPGQQAQFVVGDQVDGYFEGYTHAHAKGEGYVRKSGTIFRDYVVTTNAQPRLRDAAGVKESVLPYGRRVRHADGITEEMALLAGRQAIAVALTSPRAAVLGLRPDTGVALTGATLQRIGNAIVLAQGATKEVGFLAFSANRPLVFPNSPGAGPLLQSRHPVRALTIVAAFGTTPELAARNAQQLARSAPLAKEQQARHATLTNSILLTDDIAYNRALLWAKAAADVFVVEEFGSGIWAGLPWFRDNWGRDTFIALPGTLLVSGQFDKARAVLHNFARYQNREPGKEFGRVPNRVAAGDSIIYNTVDGAPWMLREALEYIRYTGDLAFAAEMLKLAKPYFEGALAHHVDADGLLTHDDADTWMDARIEGKQAWSARGSRAVEIQALWYTALQTGAALAEQAGEPAQAAAWRALAQRARASFLRLFWDGKVMADRLRPDGSRDLKVRPNQLMLVSIPFDDFVPPAVQASVTRDAVSALLYPYGITSLSQDDPYFHPLHENPAFHHKDAAYHQGTVWGWNAGFTVTALNKFGYQDLAYALTRNLGEQILGLGAHGNMSELLDALPDEAGKIKPSGTYAQSWSVAEYARNAYQDFVGFRPDLLGGRLAFVPAVPQGWQGFHARLPFGNNEKIMLDFARAGAGQSWTFTLQGKRARQLDFHILHADKSRSVVRFALQPGAPAVLTVQQERAALNGKPLPSVPAQASYAALMGELQFRTPRSYRAQSAEEFPMLRGRDSLKEIIERGAYR